ncbi:XRE family transcriptional regulator [Rhodococcus sp. T2V]|uniref:helix-turn-helix domain-containing protein n=1 Tax=Rhodococcus sp. T2V TaxID=3034164 RepID=UPI0023E31388|nr:XRE family transcriptional regulator [Rhodococcus sp. T2V]MDF3313343.1 XRE family transcriptional regulator [Rhodococcus sp. T2V]
MNDNDITETTSVWEAISNTPGEAYTRQLRADLMTAIRAQIDRFGRSQAVAADNLGVTQPRISNLHRGTLWPARRRGHARLVNRRSAVPTETPPSGRAA